HGLARRRAPRAGAGAAVGADARAPRAAAGRRQAGRQGEEGGEEVILPRAADQLLLPVNPIFVWFTLLIAFAMNLVPLGRNPAMPDFLALVLVFWNVHQPRRVGVGLAFLFGLMM